MAQREQNLFRLENFYDQMDFTPKQRLLITKAIIERTDPLEARASLRAVRGEATGSRILPWLFIIMTGATI